MKDFKGTQPPWNHKLGTEDDFSKVLIGDKSIKLGFTDIEIDNANASLIAAAPELLNALICCVEMFKHHEIDNHIVQLAKETINKALNQSK